jgi:glucans biosynthesis protein
VKPSTVVLASSVEPLAATRPAVPWLRRASRAAAAALIGLSATWAAAAPFSLEQVEARARELSARPYQPSSAKLPAELLALNYDRHRDIRFKPDRALWRDRGLPFEIMFFHPGWVHRDTVRIHEVTPQGAVRDLPFDARDFDYGANKLKPQAWGDIGWAGLRVHYPLNQVAYKDELIVFLGASYFRALGKGQSYGLSARGLAIDTVGGKGGEEFPRFTEFWVQQPAKDAKSLVIWALLDSPRLAGAYRFEVRPGEDTTVDVQARLYPRTAAAGAADMRLGIAPLTSMFLFGENQPPQGSFRPEVHDSDGLLVATGEGEWIWRPLVNPPRVLTTSFATRSPRGFGLMQRDRQFHSYEDTEAHYERRPSAWVEPRSDWGAGRVELVLLPTPDETHDNVVAYWVPQALPPAGQPLRLDWRLHWQGQAQQRPPGGWTVQSRRGAGFQALAPGEAHYVVDFDGPALRKLRDDTPVEAVVTAGPGGEVLEHTVHRNPATGHWRLALRVRHLAAAKAGAAASAATSSSAAGFDPVELRAFLRHRNDALTETWSNLLLP